MNEAGVKRCGRSADKSGYLVSEVSGIIIVPFVGCKTMKK
jgi:hypothetical protein